MPEKIKILFLCTGNSCRSQMAEGFTRKLKREVAEPYSAGIEKKKVAPLAIKVMHEAGINISSQESKTIDELPDIDFNYVIMLCNDAYLSCPVFPAKTAILHFGFDDPPRLALNSESEDEALLYYRRVRDEIRSFVEKLPDILSETA